MTKVAGTVSLTESSHSRVTEGRWKTNNDDFKVERDKLDIVKLVDLEISKANREKFVTRIYDEENYSFKLVSLSP